MYFTLFRFPFMLLAATLLVLAVGCSDPPVQNNASDTSARLDMGDGGASDTDHGRGVSEDEDLASGPAECGNGVVEDGEVCDDGNRHSTDYCSWNCKEIIGYCGDEITQSNEDCEVDDEPEPCAEDELTCLKCIDCQLVEVDNNPPARCGDGVVQRDAGEQCERVQEPSNAFSGGGSDSNSDLSRSCIECRWVVHECGNGELQPEEGEVCDSGWRAANRRSPPALGECLNNCEGYRRVERLVVSESNTTALTNITSFYMWGSDSDGQIGNSGIARNVPTSHHLGHTGPHFDARGGMFCRATYGVYCWAAPFGLIFPAEHPESIPYYIPTPMYYYSPEIELMDFRPEWEMAVGNDSVYVRNQAGEVSYREFAADVWSSYPDPPSGTVALPAPAVAIDAGEEHACAILTDGAVYCWGNLGEMFPDASFAPLSSPVENPRMHGAIAIYAGNGSTLYLTAQGKLEGIGANDYGQLDWSDVSDPAYVSFHDEHACVITSTGEVVCKGRNDHGQLGGSPGANHHTITEFTDAVQVAVGVDHTCALTASEDVWCWGSSEDGKLGVGQNDGLDYPPTRITTWVDDWERVDAPEERTLTSGACMDDADCPAGVCWRTVNSAGICVLRDCSERRCFDGGGICLPIPDSEHASCLPQCAEDSDCGEGALCIDIGSRQVCLPLPPPTEKLGEPCAQDTDCGDSSCLKDVDGVTPGGYCTRECGAIPCGEGEVCGDFARDGEVAKACLESCIDQSDCREGYECRALYGTPSRACVGMSWETLPPE